MRKSIGPYALSLLRIVAGFIHLCRGVQHLFGFFGPAASSGSMQWYAGIIEVSLAPLIILGLATVPAAFILSGEMAVAYFSIHLPRGSWLPIKDGSEQAVLLSFIYLYLIFAGGGAISLDHLIIRSRRALGGRTKS